MHTTYRYMLFIFLLFALYNQQTPKTLQPWDIKLHQWDKILFQNNERYIVEGKGAMHVFLGYPQKEIYRLLGKPTYRENSAIEKLHYHLPHVKGFFMLKNGFIRLIRVYIPQESGENFYPFTALGFHSFGIQNVRQEQIEKEILQTYPRAPYIKYHNTISIYSRGITYGFRNGRLSYIEVYKPEFF